MSTGIIVAGDFCPRFRTAEMFEKEQYEEVLYEVVPYVSVFQVLPQELVGNFPLRGFNFLSLFVQLIIVDEQ